MIVEMQEFMSEQTQALGDQVEKFRRNPQRFVRKALVDSAEGLKALKRPVRMVAHSGVKLTAVSQSTLASLIDCSRGLHLDHDCSARAPERAVQTPMASSTWCVDQVSMLSRLATHRR